MKTYFKDFILEQTGKYVTVYYKIIINDLKDNPKTLITDFKIITSEDKKNTIKAKGYTIDNIGGYVKKKVWIAFDDFKDDKTRIVWNKQIENGTKRIKVYQ
ncbi:hypothetical protein M0Q97_02685 [Candidatus Dojkabacteria bacterium]|jgi:hypothetical protein|nr:hypothetical protein [Candidatus Dojkabacteria bacterium]